MLARDRGQNHPANAGSRLVLWSREGASAVDGDFVAARRQASRELIGERLESAVARGNAPRPENGNFHRLGDRLRQPAIMSGFARVASCGAKEMASCCGGVS